MLPHLLQLHHQLVLLRAERLQPQPQLTGPPLAGRRLGRQALRFRACLCQPPLPRRLRRLVLLQYLLVLPAELSKAFRVLYGGR